MIKLPCSLFLQTLTPVTLSSQASLSDHLFTCYSGGFSRFRYEGFYWSIYYRSGSQFQSSRPTALHISYVTLITSDVCSIRTQVPCEVDITGYSSMIPVRSERIPFIVHWSVRDVNLNCIYLQTYMMSHSSVRKDVAQRKSINECSEVK